MYKKYAEGDAELAMKEAENECPEDQDWDDSFYFRTMMEAKLIQRQFGMTREELKTLIAPHADDLDTEFYKATMEEDDADGFWKKHCEHMLSDMLLHGDEPYEVYEEEEIWVDENAKSLDVSMLNFIADFLNENGIALG